MVKCVILAAGEGKRIHPLTYTRPKVMLPVANKPILEWNLLNAIKAGLKEFIFIVSYKSEMVRNYFGDGEKYKVKINYVNQGEPKGTAHAIGVVERFADDFIVLCGDTVFSENDIKKIVKKKNCIGLFKVKDVNEYGLVETKNDKVIRIFEKMDNPFTDVINAGVYHFDKNVFDFIRKTGKSMRGEYEITDTINMMADKSMVSGVMLNKWRDVVYPWHLLDANEEVLREIDKKILGTIEENVTIKEKVIVGKNTVIMNGCYIEGPVVIGDNCKIGPNCYIRPFTSIGDGCHIGNACEVKNSIVFNGSNIPHQNYVGDSIIGSGCNFGAGAKVANLRFDKNNIMVTLNGMKIDSKRRKLGVIMGDYVQIGINSMVNVGTIVGDHVFIGPGAIVSGEIASFSQIL
jgi:bifunctional UDP-N-acetylglucosamine pyrophosphorylase/glucosamine-1-phosphate N-acetyltransferase